MKVVIDRSKWLRGGRYGDGSYVSDGTETPSLLCAAGQRCCLGFLGRECGLPDDDLCGVPLPGNTYHRSKWTQELFSPSSLSSCYGGGYSWQTAFADINDSFKVDDATRESWLVEGFRVVLGVELEFVDGEP